MCLSEDMSKSKIIIGDATQLNISDFPNRYGVIVADPPWRYDFSIDKRDSIEDHYQTMTIESICSMPVQKIAAENSVCLLWGTWPKMPWASLVLESWGFEHVTGFPWVKMNSDGLSLYYGMGHWVRGCSEFVVIGRRGNVSPPRLEGFLGLMSPNLQHSRKPDDIYEIAEALPGPYLELFARRSRDGWHSFGNEVEDVMTGQTFTAHNNGMHATAQPRLFTLD